jgi:hypothetical protein
MSMCLLTRPLPEPGLLHRADLRVGWGKDGDHLDGWSAWWLMA